MDISKLLQLESHIQILSVIDKASLFGGDIWQHSKASLERNLTHIIQTNADMRFERITFRTNGLVEFDSQSPLFVRLNYRNLIFKLDPSQFKISGDRIVCNCPKTARALEMRKGERYVLPYDSDISLSLKRTERNMREIIYEMELRIIDVSEKGFGILISGRNREYLKKGDHFWLRSINHTPLHHHILGSVCYVAPKGYYLKKGDVRVGLSLNMAVSQEIFESLKKKCMLVLTA